jgi:hypothetical protein
MPSAFSESYLNLLRDGPFPGQIDPWAERDDYFGQMHGQIIAEIIRSISDSLFVMGYRISREASLQITHDGRPDIAIMRAVSPQNLPRRWDYARTAEAAQIDAGVAITALSPELTAVYVHQGKTLVTVVEVVSPGNKTHKPRMARYRERRNRLLAGGVNIVEIDLTRSVERLLQDSLVSQYPYHYVIYLPSEPPRLVGIPLGMALKQLALPLRAEILPIDVQQAYTSAYRAVTIAPQIFDAGLYEENNLPFRSLFTADERRTTLDALLKWVAALEALKAQNMDGSPAKINNME